MKKRKQKPVETQDLAEMWGSARSYERFVAKHEDYESVLANPDQLTAQTASPSTPQLVMGEAIQHLQGRQKEVYLAVMRDYKSILEAAEILGIGKSTAQTHLDRAIAFISAYCKEAIARGRV